MSTPDSEDARIRQRLIEQRTELKRRIEVIHDHAKSPLERDSAEQAAQLGNLEVVAALEAEASAEVAALDAALQRLDAGTYGICTRCGEPVGAERLQARPAAAECLPCAERSSRG